MEQYFFTGIICVILGVVIVFFDLRFPSKLATFFSADVLQDADDVVHDGNIIFLVSFYINENVMLYTNQCSAA